MMWGEKTFADCSLVLPTDAMPPNFVVKSFKKTSKFMKIFSLECSPYMYGKRQQVAKTSEYYVATSQ